MNLTLLAAAAAAAALVMLAAPATVRAADTVARDVGIEPRPNPEAGS